MSDSEAEVVARDFETGAVGFGSTWGEALAALADALDSDSDD